MITDRWSVTRAEPTCRPTDRKLEIRWNGSNGFSNGREEAVGLPTAKRLRNRFR